MELSGSSHIGKKIAKNFDGDLYYGQVVAWFPKTTAEETELWRVVYTDGDEEDFSEDELKEWETTNPSKVTKTGRTLERVAKAWTDQQRKRMKQPDKSKSAGRKNGKEQRITSGRNSTQSDCDANDDVPLLDRVASSKSRATSNDVSALETGQSANKRSHCPEVVDVSQPAENKKQRKESSSTASSQPGGKEHRQTPEHEAMHGDSDGEDDVPILHRVANSVHPTSATATTSGSAADFPTKSERAKSPKSPVKKKGQSESESDGGGDSPILQRVAEHDGDRIVASTPEATLQQECGMAGQEMSASKTGRAHPASSDSIEASPTGRRKRLRDELAEEESGGAQEQRSGQVAGEKEGLNERGGSSNRADGTALVPPGAPIAVVRSAESERTGGSPAESEGSGDSSCAVVAIPVDFSTPGHQNGAPGRLERLVRWPEPTTKGGGPPLCPGPQAKSGGYTSNSGRAPQQRLCRRCGKPGHFAKTCGLELTPIFSEPDPKPPRPLQQNMSQPPIPQRDVMQPHQPHPSMSQPQLPRQNAPQAAPRQPPVPQMQPGGAPQGGVGEAGPGCTPQEVEDTARRSGEAGGSTPQEQEQPRGGRGRPGKAPVSEGGGFAHMPPLQGLADAPHVQAVADTVAYVSDKAVHEILTCIAASWDPSWAELFLSLNARGIAPGPAQAPALQQHLRGSILQRLASVIMANSGGQLQTTNGRLQPQPQPSPRDPAARNPQSNASGPAQDRGSADSERSLAYEGGGASTQAGPTPGGLVGYMLFCKHNREAIKQKVSPSKWQGGGQILGRLWAQLSHSDKAMYNCGKVPQSTCQEETFRPADQETPLRAALGDAGPANGEEEVEQLAGGLGPVMPEPLSQQHRAGPADSGAEPAKSVAEPAESGTESATAGAEQSTASLFVTPSGTAPSRGGCVEDKHGAEEKSGAEDARGQLEDKRAAEDNGQQLSQTSTPPIQRQQQAPSAGSPASIPSPAPAPLRLGDMLSPDSRSGSNGSPSFSAAKAAPLKSRRSKSAETTLSFEAKVSKTFDVDEEDVENVPAFGSKHVGKMVSKEFNGSPFLGKIVSFKPPVGSDAAIWHVVYNDGDEEDLEEDEVVACRKALKDLPEPPPPILFQQVERVAASRRPFSRSPAWTPRPSALDPA